MPRTARCWSAWNYRVSYDAGGRVAPSTIYWINRLQGIDTRRNYFISINGEDTLRPEQVLRAYPTSIRCSTTARFVLSASCRASTSAATVSICAAAISATASTRTHSVRRCS